MSKHSLADITAAARDPHLLDRMIAAAAEQGHPYPASQIADAAARIVATPITEAGDSIASVYAYAVQTPADAGARSEPGRGPRPARPGRRRRSPRRTRSPRSVSR